MLFYNLQVRYTKKYTQTNPNRRPSSPALHQMQGNLSREIFLKLIYNVP
jgi:hypothetical protein